MKIGALCAGYGGLEMAVQAVFPDAKPIWFFENGETASRILAHRYPDVPNHGDITTADWSALERVDILTAGFPCQDISNAGKREGINGKRSGIYRNVVEAIGVLRPRFALLENVAAIRTRGLSVVAEDLAEVGYDLRWTTLRASDVGGGHHRARWFGLATPADTEGFGWSARRTESAEQQGAVRRTSGDGGELPSDSHSKGLEVGSVEPAWNEQPAPQRSGPGPEDAYGELGPERCCTASGQASRGGHGPTLNDEVSFLLPHSNCIGWDGRPGDESEPQGRDEPSNGRYSPAEWWGDYLPAIRRWEDILGRQAPEPTEIGPRGGRRLAARFAEWLMGLAEGHVTDVPSLNRAKQLHAIGNGVVPQQAEAALRLFLCPEGC